MKRLIAVFLLAVLLITVAGCTDIDLKLEITPEQTKAAEPSQPEQPDTSIVDRLRQQMQPEMRLCGIWSPNIVS